MPAFDPPTPLITADPTATLLVALLVLAIGLGFAAFLWWLAARSFALLQNPATTPAQVAALRDLPMGLPEGTVRAVLALTTGVIGLPLLLFSQSLGLRDAVIGYLNGIIAGVFGFYFGTRGAGQEVRRMGTALDAAQQQASTARQDAEQAIRQASTAAADAARPTRVAAALSELDRQLEIAGTLVETLGPALPPGLLPANAPSMLARARAVAQAARGLADGQVNEADLQQLASATADLAGGDGPFTRLLRQAAGILPAAAGGPLAGIAALLGLGYDLGSAAYRRWRAQVLAAPHDPLVFDAGLITPGAAELALQAAPRFAAAFGEHAQEPGFLATLLDQALRPDGAALLWAAHGQDAPGIDSEGAMAEALAEFRHALLADRCAADITDAVAGDLARRLPGAAPSAADLRALVQAAPQGGDAQQRMAFEATVTLLDTLRQKRIDPVPALRGLVP